MKFTTLIFKITIFNLIVLSTESAKAVEIQYGSGFKKYVSDANKEGDLIKFHGENYKSGFGSPKMPYVYPGCLVKTIPVSSIGPGKLRAELEFYASQILALRSLDELFQNVLFGFFVSWDMQNGTRETRYVVAPSNNLENVVPLSRSDDGRQFYFIENSGFEPPLVTPEYPFDGKITNISVSVCNLMADTSISIRKINLTVVLDQE